MNPQPVFLSIDDVLALHAIAIEDQGGDPSIRDRSLLESAAATPTQQFDGQYLHEDIPTMAAAYAFHVCNNHPFVDGNKRAATAAMIAVLSDNGWSFDATADEAEPVIFQLAAGELDKPTWTDWARNHMREKPKMELREFFMNLDMQTVYDMTDSVVSSGSEAEASATVADAERAIPMICQLNEPIKKSRDEKNEKAENHLVAMRILLTAIHRITEDMGYEW